MDNLTYEELKEVALGLNLLLGERNAYLVDDSNNKYREDIERFLEMDKELIKKIKIKIDELKE